MPPRIALIGFGRFGRSLALALPEYIRVLRLRSTDRPQLPDVLRGVEVYHDDTWLPRLGGDIDTVWIATSDAAIASVALQLARNWEKWDGITVLHSSGATSGAVLDPLVALGAHALALHPNGAFTGTEPIPSGLLWTASTADPAALQTAHNLLARLSPAIVTVLDENRSLYHAAASVASNYAVTLFAAAQRLYERAGIPGTEAAATVARFLGESAMRARELGPEAALTGPIVRGDEEVARSQAQAVRAAAPELAALFDELAAATRALAGRDAPSNAASGEQAPGDQAVRGIPSAQSGQESGA